MKPSCPSEYKLDTTKCICIKKTKKNKLPKLKSITVKKKYPRCPNGTKRNKKTGICEPTKKSSTKYSLSTKASPYFKKSSVKKRKRCPNGTKRNNITGKCEKSKIVPRANIEKNTPTITLKDTTPADLQLISKEIAQIAKKTPTMMKQKSEVLQTVKAELIKTKSFSPSVNKLLTKIKQGHQQDNFGCNVGFGSIDWSGFKIAKFDNTRPPQVRVGGTEKRPICKNFDTKEAQTVMLNNLNLVKKIDANYVLSPKQYQSNCWFNSFFMAFFISDKGRKFFRYFRTFMITGKKANGKTINYDLHKAFFMLNTAIEASLNADKTQIINVIDTNNIIFYIHKVIPHVAKVGQSSNPISYYTQIMHFLDDKNVKFLDYHIHRTDITKYKSYQLANEHIINHEHIIPEVVGVTISDSESRVITKKTTEFTINDKITYRLDSAVVRDIDKNHFCTLLTIDGKEYAFDGASYKRLTPFNWKNKINKNIQWTFEYSQQLKKMFWNFRKGYYILFYYRVK